MNKSSFAKILSNPNLVTEETLSMLKEIIDEYPFFQAGRMLLLKNMHKTDHIRYNSELKHSAVYIPDRTKLFFLLNDLGKESEEVTLPNIPVIKKQEPIVSNNGENQLEKQEDQVFEERKEEKIEETKSDKKTLTITDNYLNASDDYIEESSSFYNLSFSKSFRDTEEKEEEFDDIVLPAADLLDYESTSSGVYTLPELDEISNVDTDENRSFSDWLHIMRYSNSTQEKDKSEKKSGMDLIDNFLSKDPKIIPNASKKHVNIDLSEKKEEGKEDILSETLAAIYIKQGHKSKAISIFEKLRLKYPEKNAYFARRISELKEN